ncbi:DUF4352 domain-containing protein [Caproicibacterium sp. XB1]|uniref:DUF4352 domain-containing protein n=1 Tax=Caproicibacterium sp. XB1 TaxID=3396405 RepID=UPI0039B6EF18
MHASHQPTPQTQHVSTLTPMQPKKEKRKGCFIGAMSFFITVIVITAVVATVASKNPGAFQSAGNVSSKQSSSDAAQSEDVPAPIGTAVSNGKVSIKVNSASETSKIEDETGLTYYKPSDGAKFIVVNLTTENVGNEMYSFLCNNFQLIGPDKKQYSPSIMIAKNYLNSGTINPGLSETGNIAYEVPQSLKTSDCVLEFQEFLSINKAKFSLSGSAVKTSVNSAASAKPVSMSSAAPRQKASLNNKSVSKPAATRKTSPTKSNPQTLQSSTADHSDWVYISDEDAAGINSVLASKEIAGEAQSTNDGWLVCPEFIRTYGKPPYNPLVFTNKYDDWPWFPETDFDAGLIKKMKANGDAVYFNVGYRVCPDYYQKYIAKN